jgi:hypothetical protein
MVNQIILYCINNKEFYYEYFYKIRDIFFLIGYGFLLGVILTLYLLFHEDIEYVYNVDTFTENTDNCLQDNDKSLINKFKFKFDKFLSMFSSRHKNVNIKHIEYHIEYLYPIKNYDHIMLKDEKLLVKSEILTKIYNLNYKSTNLEIEILKSKILALEIQYIKDNIDRLNSIKLMDTIIKDLDTDLSNIRKLRGRIN